MQYLPVNLRLDGRTVLVVGGGVVAARKIALLARTGARIRVVAPEAIDEIRAHHAGDRLQWHARGFSDQDLDGIALAFVASNDAGIQKLVSAAARERGVPVNVVDNRPACDFIMPAIVDRNPVLISISSSGASPVLARNLRARIEALLPATLGPVAEFLDRHREAVKQAIPDSGARRVFFDRLLADPIVSTLEAGRESEAETLLKQALAEQRPGRGLVSLVGAGPGDPELLTIKALRRLQQADAIVHDGLVDERILEYARRDAEFIDVAKRCGKKRISQPDINQLLRDRALRGDQVVRLKSGDPFVFGRGGEELEYLKRWRIPFEVIPGITAAAGCAAYAGIPLTHRDHASALTLATAHGQDSVEKLDWADLARARQTLCFYMGVGNLGETQTRLITHGRDPQTPVAFVENGTRPEQRIITGQLANMAELARDHELKSPAMVFVGETTALAKELAWFGSPPENRSPGKRSAPGSQAMPKPQPRVQPTALPGPR